MFGIKISQRKGRSDEAEKPFWISFSDLMTALMVLFLVSMAVALMAVTQEINKSTDERRGRQGMIDECMNEIDRLTKLEEFKGLTVKGYSVDFGTLVKFQHNEDKLSPEQARVVRAFVPRVLDLARRKNCETWLKRVVVEGFASQTGGYLENLDLSFRRSQRILCILLDPRSSDSLGSANRNSIRKLFLAGGSSFNTSLRSEEEMRRVELRLEFRDRGVPVELNREIPEDKDPTCPNDLRQ